MKKHYDIFISYRRVGGDHTAMAIRDRLTAMGYRVFLDVEALRSGPFNRALYDVIENCADMLVILSPHALDRCVNEDDWVRLEVEHGLARGKNVIPILTRGFEFPEDLPEGLEPLRHRNGVSDSAEFFDASMKKLVTFLHAKPVRSRMLKTFLAAVSLILVLVLTVELIIPALTQYPFSRKEKAVTGNAIAYVLRNYRSCEDVVEIYGRTLDICMNYVNSQNRPERSAGIYLDQDTVNINILQTQSDILAARDSLQAPGAELVEEMRKEPFTENAFAMVPTMLMGVYDEMLEHLEFLTIELQRGEPESRDLQDSLEYLQQIAQFRLEYLYYRFNWLLLPITNEDTLDDLRTEVLMNLKTIYSDQKWIQDAQELDGQLEQLLCDEEAYNQKFQQGNLAENQLLKYLNPPRGGFREQSEYITAMSQKENFQTRERRAADEIIHTLTCMNQSRAACQKVLEGCSAVFGGHLTGDELETVIEESQTAISEAMEALKSANEILQAELADSPDLADDIMAMVRAAHTCIELDRENVIFLKDAFLEPSDFTVQDQEAVLNGCSQILLLRRDRLIYNFNDTLLKFRDQEIVEEVKTQVLPEMTALYSGQPWSDDAEELKELMGQCIQEEDQVFESLAMQLHDNDKVIDMIRFWFIARDANPEVDPKRQELEKKQQELAALKAEAYEKFRPLETDDLDLLWGKGLRFLTINMPDAAVECFEMYARKGGEIERLCGQTAVQFVQEMDDTGITGGCMVMGYEEGFPRQAVELGDIIYALDGMLTLDIQAFLDQRVQDAEQIASVLRMTPGGYELLEIPLTPDCGRIALNGLNETNN